MVLQRRLKDEIDKFILLLEVALQVERAQLGDVELEVPSLLWAQIRVDSAARQFYHSSLVATVELNQARNRIKVVFFISFVRTFQTWQPSCKLSYELRLVMTKLLLLPA